MKSIPKSTLLLLGLVLTVYLARQSDFSLSKSFTRVLGGSLRALSSGNRPSESLCVGVDLDNPVTQKQIDKANGYRDYLQDIRGGNPLKDVVEKGTTDDIADDYFIPFIGVVAPWIVFFVITFLVCITFCCNWCCMFGICKKMSICKCCKEPKESSKKKIFAGFTALFLICALGSSIAGLTFSSGVSEGIDLTLCAFLNVVEDLAYGKMDEGWIGVVGAVDAIGDIITQFDSAVNNLGSMQTQVNDLTTSSQNVLDSAKDYYDNNKNLVVDKVIPNISMTTYKPLFIENLGPETDQETASGSIQLETKITYNLIYGAAGPINTAVNSLKGNNDIKDTLEKGKASAETIASQIGNIIDEIGDNGKTVKDVTKIIGSALTGVFGANLGIAIFAFTSMVMVGILKIKFFNKLLHLSWCLILILTFLGFILAILTFPLSVVMIEACDVINTALDDQTFFKNSMNTFAKEEAEARDTIALCFFTNDGDILSRFNITEQMGYFDTIFENLDNITAEFDIDTITSFPSLVIPPQYALIENFKTGLVSDSPYSAADLIVLNQKVDKDATSACTTADDTWVFNTASCTGAMGAQFASSSGATYDLPNPTCVGFDNWITAGYSGSQRYTNTYFSACTGSEMTEAQNIVDRFKTNRNQLAVVMDTVKNSLDTVDAAHTQFANDILAVFGKLSSVKSDLTGIKNSIDGPDGLLSNSKCTFIRNDLKALTDAMCVGFISNLYQTSLIIIITSFFTLLSTMAIFCLAKRFLAPSKKAISP